MASEIPKIPILSWETQAGTVAGSKVPEEANEVLLSTRLNETKSIGIVKIERVPREYAIREMTKRAVENAEEIIARLQEFVEENKGEIDDNATK